MIFESITNINDKKEYYEKFLLYMRMVEVMAEYHHLKSIKGKILDDYTIAELIDMGIITSEKDVPILKSLLKNDYDRFIISLNIFLENKEIFGNLLDKLNNKKRRLQTGRRLRPYLLQQHYLRYEVSVYPRYRGYPARRRYVLVHHFRAR